MVSNYEKEVKVRNLRTYGFYLNKISIQFKNEN